MAIYTPAVTRDKRIVYKTALQPAPPNYDPPPGIPVIQRQANGDLVVYPLAYFNYVGDDAGSINAALLQVGYGRVILINAAYQLESTVFVTPQLSLFGAGIGATTFFYSGNGVAVSLHGVIPSGGFMNLTQWGGRVKDLTIDGTAAGAAAIGFDMGDLEQGEVDIMVQNFAAATPAVAPALPTGSIGVHLNNTQSWTEKCTIRVRLLNNSNQLVLDCTTSTARESFEYNFISADMYCYPGQNGIWVINGAYTSGTYIQSRGNFSQGTAANPGGTGLAIIGSHTRSGTKWSHIDNTVFDIVWELDGVISGANPQTLYMDTSSTTVTMQNCSGMISWKPSTTTPWVPSNITINSGSGGASRFSFAGMLQGDTNLNPGSAVGGSGGGPSFFAAGSPIIYSLNRLNGNNGQILDYSGDFFECTLAANITVGLGGFGLGSPPGSVPAPQRKVFLITQAAANSYTVTWPSNAGPTPTTPNVVWAGGTAPTMTATHGAKDMYVLETFDGATWIGSAVQNVS